MSATKSIYDAAKTTIETAQHDGVCRVCGNVGVGDLFGDWVRDTFTDHDKMKPGTIICDACQFCFDESSELLTRITGKDKLQRMRNYSHFVIDGEWVPLSKGDKARMVTILRQSPEVAIIAVSGQKHLIFRAQSGWWQMEEKSILPPGVQLWPLLDAVESLYAMFTKGEIETGRYDQRRIMMFGVGQFLQLESTIKIVRGSSLLELALFLSQKKESEDGRLSTGVSSGTEAANPALAKSGWSIQAKVRTQHLGAIPKSDSVSSIHGNAEPLRQLSLF